MAEAVSVIITCFNLERYIAQCVASVKEQDYKGPIQIVVVDDCSSDSSLSILKNVPNVEIVQHASNAGVMNAILSGLKAAQHDVVFFLDGDDVWHRRKVSRCMEAFNTGARFVTHDMIFTDADGTIIPRNSRVFEVLGRAKSEDHSDLIKECILCHRDYVWLGSAFGIRRSLCAESDFVQSCLDFGDLSFCYQDWPLAVWVALQGRGSMAYIDDTLFGYRVHGSNYSGSSETVQKLQRNLRKALNTVHLIEYFFTRCGAHPRYLAAYRKCRMSYSVQLAAAEGPRSRIAAELIRSAPHLWFSKRGLKPLLRAGLSLLLGPKFAHSTLKYLKGSL